MGQEYFQELGVRPWFEDEKPGAPDESLAYPGKQVYFHKLVFFILVLFIVFF